MELEEITTAGDLRRKLMETERDYDDVPVRIICRVSARDADAKDTIVTKEYHGTKVGIVDGPDGKVFVVDSAVMPD